MTITLGDDGTMDTVLVCSDCGQEFRFNYDNWPGDMAVPDRTPEDEYQAFIDGAIEEVSAEHVCGDDEAGL